jgi:hypothetical protein
MTIDEQRRYGAAFRALSAFEEGAREIGELSRRLAEVVREGIATGALAPPQEHEQDQEQNQR